MSIIEIINKHGKNIFEIKKLYVVDTSITKLSTNRILISIPDEDRMIRIGVDKDVAIFNIIRNESSTIIEKEIYNKLSSSSDINFIDSTKYQPYQLLKKNFLYSFTSYKNILTNGMISSAMQNSPQFINIQLDKVTGSAGFYEIGNYSNFNIWVNPYQRYTDGTMMLFNNIKVNIGYSSASIVDRVENDTATRISFEFELGLEIDNPKIINIIENEKSTNYPIFLSRKRNDKIDQIIIE